MNRRSFLKNGIGSSALLALGGISLLKSEEDASINLIGTCSLNNGVNAYGDFDRLILQKTNNDLKYFLRCKDNYELHEIDSELFKDLCITYFLTFALKLKQNDKEMEMSLESSKDPILKTKV